MARELGHITEDYDVTVVGFESVFEKTANGVEWKFIRLKATLLSQIWDRVMMLIGKIAPPAYRLWYWRRKRYQDALALAFEVDADAYQANDWAALPIAVEAAKRKRAKVVYDAHEYWSLESENQLVWKMFFSPLIRHIENSYIPCVDAFVTVSPPIVRRYAAEYGVDPVLIMNTPHRFPLPPFRPTDTSNIRMVNHGTAVRDRQLEKMIEALAYADAPFTLDFILLPVDESYIEELKDIATRLVPGRVKFHPPMPKSEILLRVAEYDIGIYIMAPISYNNHVALPNRFFDFIAAGLAVCVGPSPAMKELVEQYGVGIVAPTFEAPDIGASLNRLTAEQIDAMKQASRKAVEHLNAQTENQKWVALYRDLFAEHA